MSTDAVLCHSCSGSIDGPQICCQGYCSAVFHLECSGITENLLAIIKDNNQIFWMCKSCTNLLLDQRHRKSVKSAFESGQESLLNTHSQMVKEIKGEILTELRTEFRTNFATLINSNSLTPRSAQRRPRNKPEVRRLFGNNTTHEKQSQQELLGTGKPVSPTLGTMLATDPTPKFWLYITRISRRVTVEQVTKLAVERLGTEDVEVTRLVAKGKDVNTMSFISFKIGMHTTLKAKALCTSTWPQGLAFREFEERSSRNFWEPKESSNPEIPSTRCDTDKNSVSTPPNPPTNPANVIQSSEVMKE